MGSWGESSTEGDGGNGGGDLVAGGEGEVSWGQDVVVGGEVGLGWNLAGQVGCWGEKGCCDRTWRNRWILGRRKEGWDGTRRDR